MIITKEIRQKSKVLVELKMEFDNYTKINYNKMKILVLLFMSLFFFTFTGLLFATIASGVFIVIGVISLFVTTFRAIAVGAKLKILEHKIIAITKAEVFKQMRKRMDKEVEDNDDLKIKLPDGKDWEGMKGSMFFPVLQGSESKTNITILN